MKKSPKNTNHDSLADQTKKNNKEGKDYAHYPPASPEQVKPHAHKKDKDSTQKNADYDPQTDEQASSKDAEKFLNGSRKIVNSIDESYSDGSGGGFEATEQVND